MKFYTEVSCEKLSTIARTDSVCVLGSCFADEMGARLSDAGFDVLRNPFGTLYNPASIAAAVERLDSGAPFTPQDCVEMGAGAGRVCSFSHHTSFARPSAEDFLANANARLKEDAAHWRACTYVILTLGTARVWRALERPGTFGLIFGLCNWIHYASMSCPSPTGTIMVAVLTFILGFQMLLSAAQYDISAPNPFDKV